MPNSPSTSRIILKDTLRSCVVQFVPTILGAYPLASGSVTGSISASELMGYQNTNDPVKIGISKMSWNVQYGDPAFNCDSSSWGLYWGMTGATGSTASPFFYINGSGEINFKNVSGIGLVNTLTGNYNNSVFIQNVSTINSSNQNPINLILEINKMSGFGLTQAT